MLLEDSSTSSSPAAQIEDDFAGAKWIAGPSDQTCTQICKAQSRACDRSVVLNGTLDIYNDMKTSLSCQLPLLSACPNSAPTRDSDGYCWFDNQAKTNCGDVNVEPTNICDITVSSAPESENLCPCAEALPEITSDENASLNEASASATVGIALAIVVGIVVALTVGLVWMYKKRQPGTCDINHVPFDHESQQPGAAFPNQVEGMTSPTSTFLDGIWAKP